MAGGANRILFLASALTRVIDIVKLGFVNRMLGAGLGALKYMLLVGIAIHFIEFVDSKDNLIKSTVKQESVLYYPMEDFRIFLSDYQECY